MAFLAVRDHHAKPRDAVRQRAVIRRCRGDDVAVVVLVAAGVVVIFRRIKPTLKLSPFFLSFVNVLQTTVHVSVLSL